MFIDMQKAKDFSRKSIFDEVFNDLKANKIINIVEAEYVYEDIAILLMLDIEAHRCNYKCFMEKGMDLRVFAELRKSAMLYSECKEVYEWHSLCKNIADIKTVRRGYLGPAVGYLFLQGYIDEDWQLYYVMRWTTPKKYHKYFDSLDIDFDAHHWMCDTPKEYRPKIYIQEALRIYTDYDGLGRPRKEPIDISDFLWENYGL